MREGTGVASTAARPRPESARDASEPGARGSRLRVLVCPHELITGGSQIIAIDQAARLRDRGHEVMVYAPPGPLETQIRAAGLPYHAAPSYRGDSARPAVIRALLREIRDFRPDVVHTYESGPALAATLASVGTPIRHIATVGSMTIPDFIPDDVPLMPTTGDLVRSASQRRSGEVILMPVTVDAEHDAPRDMSAARARLGLDDGLVISVVGRLSAEHHKARGIILAIDALLEAGVDATLLVAGTGDEEDLVREAATRADGTRLRVRLEGNVADPRDIYAAADVGFGMGSSAARAISHAKPFIVQGRNGFWRLLDESSADDFVATGFFGDGPSGGPGFAELVQDLERDARRREELGAFGRRLALEQYAAATAAERLEGICVAAAHRPAGRRAAVVARSLGRYARFRVALAAPWLQRAVHRVTGRDG